MYQCQLLMTNDQLQYRTFIMNATSNSSKMQIYFSNGKALMSTLQNKYKNTNKAMRNMIYFSREYKALLC
jgi:hypothetical protein